MTSPARPVRYALAAGVATLTMDDGKVNCVNLGMLDALNEALDRAESDAVPVVLTGRPGTLSAGFDLKVFQGPVEGVQAMVRGGAELLVRLLTFPAPVVVASTGHALAMGSFLTLAGDVRVGARGAFRYGMNEVAIGIPMPLFAVALARHRLPPTHLDRAVITAELYDPDAAVTAGFLDRSVPGEQLQGAVEETAQRLLTLDRNAYAATKERVRAPLVAAVRDAIAAELM